MTPLNHGKATLHISPTMHKKVDLQKDNCSKRRWQISHRFYFSFPADEEHQQNVAAAVARPWPHEERGDAVPRRRRNMGTRMMAQRRAQQAEDWVEGNVWFSSSCKH